MTTTAETKVLAWHFVAEKDGKPVWRDGASLKVGRLSTVTSPLKLCQVGLHGSERPIDALQYAPGPWVERVEHLGEILRGTDKLCSSERRTLWVADATRTLHEFACWCVRETPLKDGRKVWDLLIDERSRKAIETKEAWLRGEVAWEKVAAAGAAAWVAAGAAAGAAAWDAAGAAAGAAAWDAAGAAAWVAAGAFQNAELERRLLALRNGGRK